MYSFWFEGNMMMFALEKSYGIIYVLWCRKIAFQRKWSDLMLDITKLVCGGDFYGDGLRYSHGTKGERNGVSKGRGPVVVWNCTKTCNLKCKHCYSSSDSKKYPDELSTEEAKYMIRSLSQFHVPVLLISGGEPLLREDLLELVSYCKQYQIRTTISTNGTLIHKDMAKALKAHEVGYVGISIDGIGAKHDLFRGVEGSFEKSLEGIRNCIAVEQKVGLRFTIGKDTVDQLEDVFYLIKQENIPRVCFYHLVYSGRGSELMNGDLTHEQMRDTIDYIVEQAKRFGSKTEILTVDNHADGVYLYLKMKKENPEKAKKIFELLQTNGGNRSGIAIGNIDYRGFVHPDQFTSNHVMGNIREKDFSQIWTDMNNPIVAGLKDRKSLLKGRCKSCQWKDVCNGNFRARAEAVTGDFWESDPACYLTEQEIGGQL